ncbi:recombinase family protein [Agrococcus casei]|uniref:DNA-invertase n=1 Tax=Agrococcus casei LMG 22410 TaxID=1255656 RepID=A0A1R4FYM2_9MICO|nr:recombinase family protein [Agrococcus casei]SJM61008.1 DNA-invertase [Agrococcus casei LMG 22410]
MALIGYGRTSTPEQDAGVQLDALTAAGAERVFLDAGQSSRKRDRPEWIECRKYLRAGDVLLVYRLDRLAGSTDMMIELIHELGESGIHVRSLTEPEIDTTSPMGRALFGMVAVFVQLRVDTIRQNTRDGLARARSHGRIGGRPSVQTPEMIAAAAALRGGGASFRRIAAQLNVSEATVRRMLRARDG